MAFRKEKITTIHEFLELVIAWASDNHFVLFRGQGNSKYDLIPGIARTPKNKRKYDVGEIINVEKEIMDQFYVLSNHHFSNFQVDKKLPLEMLSLAQHFGMPTRLLDWTSNPLAALFFALQSIEEDDKDGNIAVWGYCIKENDRRVLSFDSSDSKDPFKINNTYIFKPKTVTPRIKVQAGWFTLHHCNSKKGFVPLNKDEDYTEDLAKITIPKSAVARLRKELDILHVNFSTLFPDISGTSKHLSWKIFRKYDDFKDVPSKNRY